MYDSGKIRTKVNSTFKTNTRWPSLSDTVVGAGIVELPLTTKGNRYLIVFQDLITKWHMGYPAPDQKAERIVRLLVEEIVPLYGVLEALLSDRDTNLFSILMQDICRLLGIKKLNMTTHHLQCDGMIEKLNRTCWGSKQPSMELNGIPTFQGPYGNVPHSSTGEKPSYLLFSFDCHTPTKAALLPTSLLKSVIIENNWLRCFLHQETWQQRQLEKLSVNTNISMTKYVATTPRCKVGDWVFVYLPSEDTGWLCKLSQPLRGPFCIISRDNPDVTVVKVYFPDDPPLQVHQLRVKSCPMSFPCAYYWYGNKRSKPGRG